MYQKKNNNIPLQKIPNRAKLPPRPNSYKYIENLKYRIKLTTTFKRDLNDLPYLDIILYFKICIILTTLSEYGAEIV